MKKLLAFLLIMIMAFTMVACSTPAEEPAVEEQPAESAAEQVEEEEMVELTKIGFSSDVLSTNFTSGLATNLQEQCDALGIEVEMLDANRDMNLQISHVENLITNGAQAIILKPYDVSACAPISAACEEAGVPLIVITSAISSHYDVSVMVDNFTMGRQKAEALVEAIGGEGNVTMILGTLTQQSWAEQAEAAREVFAANPGITILDEQVADDNKAELALSITENWITAGYEMDAIWAAQDTVAIAAGLACQEAGLDVYIVGGGGMEDAQNAINDGTLSASIYLPSSVYITGAVDAAVAIFNGEEVEKDIYMETPLLDVDNIDTFDFY